MKTTITNEANVTRHWYIIDAKDQTVGRLATRIAVVLRGKHKPTFSPHVDGGDYIVVINAAHLRLTGKKNGYKTVSPVQWIPRWSSFTNSTRVTCNISRSCPDICGQGNASQESFVSSGYQEIKNLWWSRAPT